MKLPTIQGVIQSRLLLNYRVAPEVLKAMLPSPFRPKLANGFAIVGICLIRLRGLRPSLLPGGWGISVDSTAHRVAVEWSIGSTMQTGVYIFRRDCASRFVRLLGGRVFPGVHSKASVNVIESDDQIQWDVKTRYGVGDLSIDVATNCLMPLTSALGSLESAREFFAEGACGYSPRRSGGNLDGVKLCIPDFRLMPAQVNSLRSSFFENQLIFAGGSIEFDSAFLMRDIVHHWQVMENQPVALGRVG
ncbi:MAG: DUF2071 domain-containing protein [Planctomycetes bacterium]|nr:DUF2071 domain-containing protein [Planctomycetota bacterium]